jgi:hypothetical protein
VSRSPRHRRITSNGGPATSALLNNPSGIAVDSNNLFLFIADTGNNRIQMVPNNGYGAFGQGGVAYDMYTIAGSSAGDAGFSGDGGAAISALLNGPSNIAVDPNTLFLFIIDTKNNRVRMVPNNGYGAFGQGGIAGDIYNIE